MEVRLSGLLIQMVLLQWQPVTVPQADCETYRTAQRPWRLVDERRSFTSAWSESERKSHEFSKYRRCWLGCLSQPASCCREISAGRIFIWVNDPDRIACFNNLNNVESYRLEHPSSSADFFGKTRISPSRNPIRQYWLDQIRYPHGLLRPRSAHLDSLCLFADAEACQPCV